MKLLDKIKKKDMVDFIKFVIIGVIWSGINVLLMWVSVDILHIYAYIASTAAIVIVHLGRYYSYLAIKLIHPKFWKFTYTNINFTIGNIILMTLAIDVLNINTLISSIVIVGGLFALKFFTYKKINMIR